MQVSTEPLHVPSLRFAVSAFQRTQVPSGVRSPTTGAPPLPALLDEPALLEPALLAPPVTVPPVAVPPPVPWPVPPVVALPAVALGLVPAIDELEPATLVPPPLALPALELAPALPLGSALSVLEQAAPTSVTKKLSEIGPGSERRRELWGACMMDKVSGASDDGSPQGLPSPTRLRHGRRFQGLAA
jgi:hypothetical protein